jgi:type VI secretion system secreted protein VgrG
MASYVHADRQITATTPLGPDVLLLRGFSGVESLSQLFHFRLEMQAEDGAAVPFDRLVGQKVTIRLALDAGEARYINGVCNRVRRGVSDATFTPYDLEIVPQFWFLTLVAQSRIFQQVTVPEILKTVFSGVDVEFQLQGTYYARDFCVQYRETDHNFASRLMEEEGIYYYFRHSDGSHTMVVADTPQGHPELPWQSRIDFENSLSGDRQANRITSWEMTQELRSGKFTLRDHSFEIPHKPLEAQKLVADSVQVGGTSLKIRFGQSDKLEIYDYPGEYAQRFDGVDPGGGDRPADLQRIFEDNKRTVDIRMQEETASGVLIQGSGHCRYMIAGYKFILDRLEKANGDYVLVSVRHSARLGGEYRSKLGGDDETAYSNTFSCVPAALTFRPPRVTPKPVVHGTQTAVVVGPAGEEIFCDKYGRVKVQFHWDRQGKNDANSSCWVRVGTCWAGNQWGAVHIPRIGQEVIIAFEEGDPDRPIVVGSVYNAERMPPYTLPENKTQSGLKSRSTTRGTPSNFNELRFEDKKGAEQVYFHAEKDFDRVVENNDTLKVGFMKKDQGDQTIEVFNNQTLKVGTSQASEGSQTVTIYKDRTTAVETGNDSLDVKQGNRSVVIDMGNDSLSIKMGNQTTKIDLGSSTTEAMQSIELKVGQSSVKLDQTGVTIKGMMISIEGQMQTDVKGTITQINGDAMLKCQGGITMIN